MKRRGFLGIIGAAIGSIAVGEVKATDPDLKHKLGYENMLDEDECTMSDHKVYCSGHIPRCSG